MKTVVGSVSLGTRSEHLWVHLGKTNMAAGETCVPYICYNQYSIARRHWNQATIVQSWGRQMTMVIHQSENFVQYASVTSVSQEGQSSFKMSLGILLEIPLPFNSCTLHSLSCRFCHSV